MQGSPASLAYISRTQEQTREASPEEEEFIMHRAIMSPAVSAAPSIAESPDHLERLDPPSPSPSPAPPDEQEQAETAGLEAAYRIVKERLKASEAGYQMAVRELAQAADFRNDLEMRLTTKHAQVEQLTSVSVCPCTPLHIYTNIYVCLCLCLCLCLYIKTNTHR